MSSIMLVVSTEGSVVSPDTYIICPKVYVSILPKYPDMSSNTMSDINVKIAMKSMDVP